MANLTITIDERLLKQARMRALEDGTSVNALLRTYLERYAGAGQAGDSTGRLRPLGATKRGEQRSPGPHLDPG